MKKLKKDEIFELAREVLDLESQAISNLKNHLDESFIDTLETILAAEGRIVFTGMGKSGILGKKIASTFASTGTPAFYIHPGEGAHGDLGMLVKGDCLVAISYSGETSEIKLLIPVIKKLEIPMILITGNPGSELARNADIVLNIKVDREASSFGLIPTCSIAATLGIGDALAICLLELKGFKKEDFAVIHPSGTLGYLLNLHVADFMHTGSEIPMVGPEVSVKEALFEITRKGFGFTLIGSPDKIMGIITDGDIRRLLEKTDDIFKLEAGKAMTPNPKTIPRFTTIAQAIETMENFGITSLVVVDKDGCPEGIVHLHDLLGRGQIKIGFNNES